VAPSGLVASPEVGHTFDLALPLIGQGAKWCSSRGVTSFHSPAIKTKNWQADFWLERFEAAKVPAASPKVSSLIWSICIYASSHLLGSLFRWRTRKWTENMRICSHQGGELTATDSRCFIKTYVLVESVMD